eukprot:PITA_06848
MIGGVTRLKYHLARLTGHDVGICTVSSPELIQKALEAIDEKDRKKEETEINKVEHAGRSFGISSPDFDVEDRKGRTLLNFLVRCRKGTVFIKSLDALEHIKDATTICELLDGFIREIGVQNVVQVIINNAANYVSANKMLMERYHTLLWTPCATHCLNLLLEDMGKLFFIKEVVDMARSVPKFIYNHAFVLSLMRRFTRNEELQCPAITRFATNFITLQCLL